MNNKQIEGFGSYLGKIYPMNLHLTAQTITVGVVVGVLLTKDSKLELTVRNAQLDKQIKITIGASDGQPDAEVQ